MSSQNLISWQPYYSWLGRNWALC